MPRVILTLIVIGISLMGVKGQDQHSQENKFAYLTLDFSYLGAFKLDKSISASYKIGGIDKSGFGGSLGYAGILESHTTPFGDQAKIRNTSLIGGIQAVSLTYGINTDWDLR